MGRAAGGRLAPFRSRLARRSLSESKRRGGVGRSRSLLSLPALPALTALSASVGAGRRAGAKQRVGQESRVGIRAWVCCRTTRGT